MSTLIMNHVNYGHNMQNQRGRRLKCKGKWSRYKLFTKSLFIENFNFRTFFGLKVYIEFL